MNKLEMEELEGLSEAERQYAIKLLKEIQQTGNTNKLKELKYEDFDEIPVDIDTFLDDDHYLGRGLWAVDVVTGERRCTLFPYWRKTLKKLFPDNLTTSYNTLILTGAIGLGKTLMGVLAQLYLLYRMLCLKDPYGYYGMMPSDKITFSMLNITLEAAQGVGWDKLQQLLQGSDWFMEHGTLNASRSNPQWQPPKGIEIIFGSNNRHVVGRALFCNLTDEVNFGVGNNVEKQKAKQRKMIAQIDARMISRFGKGTYLPTLNIIISSKDVEQAFLNSYIEDKKKNESKTTLIIDEPQWIVRNDKGSPDDPGAFWVAIGNKFLAHELLPKDADDSLVSQYREKGYSMLKVPPIYREHFETNLDQALMDDAGYSTTSITKYISGIRLNEIKTDSYQNPFVKDVIEVGNAQDDQLQYANFFDLSRVDPRDLSRPLFIHLDLSMTGDKTGLAGVWITGKEKGVEGGNSMTYKLAFSVSIKAPQGAQVSFNKTINFINWLRNNSFAVKGVSSDTFQSASTLQDLKANGFRTNVQSVDRIDSVNRICIPYDFFKTCIYERRLQIYKKCDLLTDEITSLERLSDGHIDHPKYGSKDQSDAVCGALFLASKFSEEYAFSYGENLIATLDANTSADVLTKKDFINQNQAFFEEAITKTSLSNLTDSSNKESELFDFTWLFL